MARYVDGYVLPLPRRNLAAYRRMARVASKVWKDHGALKYCECVGDDMRVPCGIPFPRITKAKANETVVFAWIVYKSRADRDRINGKVMSDPRLAKLVDPKKMPFDMTRMTCGGFKILVEA